MATKKKLLQAAAGAAGGAGLNVEDVFSTYLYTGTNSAQTITNGIDLSGEGGLVWSKSRSHANGHALVDTETGPQTYLVSETTAALRTDSYATLGLTAFNSDGYSLGADTNSDRFNRNTRSYASWTFRKAPKFFDVVTYTGTSVGQSINHNLGATPGVIIIKKTSNTGDWVVYHRVDGSSPSRLFLNSTGAGSSTGTSGDSYFTSQHSDTTFSIGANSRVNGSGETYVAYLFAHNDDDGEFGPDGDADIIKCGSYTGNGTYEGGPEIDLGFEPQFVLLKNASSSSEWYIYDSMRGITDDSSTTKYLQPNRDYAENSTEGIELRPTGFQVMGNNVGENTSGNTYIYIAIRRGPMAVPTDADDVFAIDTSTSDSSGDVLASTFPVDAYLYGRRGGGSHGIMARLTETRLFTDSTSTEGSLGSYLDFDRQTGIKRNALLGNASTVDYMWKRAPNYFDVVAYTGNGTAGRTVSHNLGVAPEMMWVKGRDNTDNWSVYHKDLSSGQHLQLNATAAAGTNSNMFTTTAPTSSVFSLGSDGAVNGSSNTYIAYLFASLDGVSKVGSYTGNGSTQNIDCGFSSGARFILIKRTDSADGWFVHDTERGIVTGNDPYLQLNTTDAEAGSYDIVDPYSAGFTVNNFSGWNLSGGSYIFYAIA